jgi:hypothetical protein
MERAMVRVKGNREMALGFATVRFMDLMWVSRGSLIQRDYRVVRLCHGEFLDPSRIGVVWSITANLLTCRNHDSSKSPLPALMGTLA